MKVVRPRYNEDRCRTEFLTSQSLFGHLHMTCPLRSQDDPDDEESRCHDLCAWLNIESDPGDVKKGCLFCKDTKIATYFDDRMNEDENEGEVDE